MVDVYVFFLLNEIYGLLLLLLNICWVDFKNLIEKLFDFDEHLRTYTLTINHYIRLCERHYLCFWTYSMAFYVELRSFLYDCSCQLKH